MQIFEFFQMLGGSMWLYGGAFVLVLSVLVFVHEWGHYIVARMFGIRVEVFSLGFGKEIAGFYDKSGTRWKISMIPLGGYVKLFGDVDPASAGHTDSVEGQDGTVRTMTPEERKTAFFAQAVWKRALVVFAGPAINYLFALIILAMLFTFNGQPVTPPTASAIIVGSSADTSGFLPHDRVISIDGHVVTSFDDIRRDMLISLDTKKHFVVERDGQTLDIYATPLKEVIEDHFGFKHSRGLLGLISPRHAVPMANVTRIDDRAVKDAAEAQAILQSSFGKTLRIEIKQGEKSEKLIIAPQAEFNENFGDATKDDGQLLYLTSVDTNQFIHYDMLNAFGASFAECLSISTGTLEAIGQIITGTRSANELGGVIRIGAMAGDMAQQGMIALILFTALLSINLGLINLFPVPMLDGGHLVFYAFEALAGRPIPENIQEYAFRLGLVFLVSVMVFANLNDLIQLLL